MTREETKTDITQKIQALIVDQYAEFMVEDLEIQPSDDFDTSEVLNEVLSYYVGHRYAVKNDEGKIIIAKIN